MKKKVKDFSFPEFVYVIRNEDGDSTFLLCEDTLESAAGARDDDKNAIATYVLREVGGVKSSLVYSKF